MKLRYIQVAPDIYIDLEGYWDTLQVHPCVAPISKESLKKCIRETVGIGRRNRQLLKTYITALHILYHKSRGSQKYRRHVPRRYEKQRAVYYAIQKILRFNPLLEVVIVSPLVIR